MKNILNAQWIKSPKIYPEREILFSRRFRVEKKLEKAEIEITALGVYKATLNGKRIGDFIFAPGWTVYRERVQVETCDVTDFVEQENEIVIGVAPGWKARDFFGGREGADYLGIKEVAAVCALTLFYDDGETEIITSGGDWKCERGKTVYSDLYNGCVYDPAYKDPAPLQAVVFPHDKNVLVERIGEKVVEYERIEAKEIVRTPKGETAVDFGQNATGYVEFRIKGKKGERARVSHAEILDPRGNFYTENLRSARATTEIICDGVERTFKPDYNFYGFRYIKLENWSDEVKKENFTMVVVCSDIKRTGYFECSDERVNRLFENVIWGQKSNYLDVPTDCPQRDERLGWTGDAQIFAKTASYNFDVERFFKKWLADLRSEQRPWGGIPSVIPCVAYPGADADCSAAWADAAVICPRQTYLTYGDKSILADSLDSMKKYLDYIESRTENGIWDKGWHFGDWVNLDAEFNTEAGETDKRLIATAFLIYSTEIYIKSAELFGRDAGEYRRRREKSAEAFRREFMRDGRIIPRKATQTACALAVWFRISDDIPETARQLNELVEKTGCVTTGFVGTPYLLHALSENGYAKTAYDLLLREEYPSWLYPVGKGATTIWERWDGIRPDGSLQNPEMNSFNHYAYGCVADWLYEGAAGIRIDEDKPAFERIIFKPAVDPRLDYVRAKIETRRGEVRSEWRRENGRTVYTFAVPEGSEATAVIDGESFEIKEGINEIERP